ncbi:MAG TPA: NAD(P)-binding domain-containing protein [Anaerolineales bacterium]|nr:NAD(P)-binding domain-containing protein [Anaerolineales bacterium]
MNVTIIGAGQMGRGLGARFVSGGHSVTFRDAIPEAAEKTAAAVKPLARKGAKVAVAGLDDAELGEVVVLALWYGANIQVAQALGAKLAGRVVVDIANPLNKTLDGLATDPDSSSAEEVARAVASGAKVVKAFNTTFAGTLLAGQVAGQPLDVFIAGDDAEAKDKVARLVRDGGMHAIDAGPLQRARQIETMQLLHIVLQDTLGTNWGSALKILS